MKRLRFVGVVLLAVSGLGAVTVSVAQAEEAPFWSIGGTRLAAGKTHFTTTKVFKEGEAGQELTLTTPKLGIVISCTGVSLPFETGVILGSEAETPGTNDGVVHFTGCTVTGNGTGCNIENKEITTKPIKAELVLNVESKAAGKTLLVELSPSSGEVLGELKFKEETGGKCTNKTTKVTGSVAAEVLNEKEEAVRLPNTHEEGTSGLTRFPATAIEKVWLVKAGVGKEVEVGPLLAFGDDSTATGTILGLLAKVTGTTLESETTTKWSALP